MTDWKYKKSVVRSEIFQNRMVLVLSGPRIWKFPLVMVRSEISIFTDPVSFLVLVRIGPRFLAPGNRAGNRAGNRFRNFFRSQSGTDRYRSVDPYTKVWNCPSDIQLSVFLPFTIESHTWPQKIRINPTRTQMRKSTYRAVNYEKYFRRAIRFAPSTGSCLFDRLSDSWHPEVTVPLICNKKAL